MDRNTVIGFALLALLFIGYFYYSRQGQLAVEQQKQHIQDSLNRLKPKVDSTAKLQATNDSLHAQNERISGIRQDTTTKEQLITVENKLLKITFSNKGAVLEN